MTWDEQNVLKRGLTSRPMPRQPMHPLQIHMHIGDYFKTLSQEGVFSRPSEFPIFDTTVTGGFARSPVHSKCLSTGAASFSSNVSRKGQLPREVNQALFN